MDKVKCNYCDLFAHFLLMPTEVFKYEWIKNNGDFSKLADIFGVEEERIRERILMLNL